LIVDDWDTRVNIPVVCSLSWCYDSLTMTEQFSMPNAENEESKEKKGMTLQELEGMVEMSPPELTGLITSLSEREAPFVFEGLADGVYDQTKADEQDGIYTTPIDDVIARMKEHGIKVLPGDHPETGNSYIVPADSTDVENDGIFPRCLAVTEGMDPDLKKLCAYGKLKKAKNASK
jgi:hypothetical protein